MAPERKDYGKATTYSDIYSLGVVILEMLSGKKHDHDVDSVRTLFPDF